MTPQHIKITFHDTVIVKYLSIFAGILVLTSLYGDIGNLYFGRSLSVDLAKHLMNTAREGNLSSYFSALLLLGAAALLSVIYFFHRQTNNIYTRKWLVLAIGFLLMSFDEAISIHELLIMPTRKLIAMDTYGIFHFTWVIPALVLIVILGLYFFRFVLHLAPPTGMQFVIAAAMFLGGCVGFEMLGGWCAEQYGFNHLSYIACTNTEEALEMAGIILFIKSLFAYIKKLAITMEIETI
ncbi:MAG TPA: hypothetical protein PKC80_04470 [Burkholderiaceae bacterium]|nr:hypothetical protein [Burkholderiaceae bacterium]